MIFQLPAIPRIAYGSADGPVAACTLCLNGHKESSGLCVAVSTCSDLDCSADNQACTPASGNADAVCGVCLPGYINSGGTCILDTGANCSAVPAAGTIVGQCDDANRNCLEVTGGAICNQCKAGFFEDEHGYCVAQACSDLACDTTYSRSCSEVNAASMVTADHEGVCSACLAGYVDDTPVDLSDSCREKVYCADLICGASETCLDGGDFEDDYCENVTCDLVQSEVFDPLNKTCVHCPPCSGNGLTGQLASTLSQQGHCICETQPGYYYSEAGFPGARECDEDNDGWLRASALVQLESSDPVIIDNVRCAQREITSVVLINELEQSRELLLGDIGFTDRMILV